MKKKLLAILLTVCMVLSMAPAALAADSVFTDVEADDWFADEVKYVYDNGLMNGVGDNAFDPDGTVTRAMVWTTLARLDGVDTTGSDPWWLAGQEWAMENEISDGTMVENNITREQLVTMIWRYAKYIDMDVSEGEDTNILSYTDAFDVNEWAISAMQWACAVGIINGIDGALQPQGDATRAQLAAILYRFVEEVSNAAPDTYTVTFMWNYGDKGVYETVEVEDGETVGSLKNPSRGGYSFSGWYTEDGDHFTLNTKVTEDIVVYAKWTEYVYIPVHTHNWVAGTPVAPTCSSEGYTPYTCSCGSSKNDDFVPTVEHVAGEKCEFCGVTEVGTAEQLIAAAQGSGEAKIKMLADITIDVAAWQNNALGGADTTAIMIDGENGEVDYTLTFNQTNSDWNNVVTNNGAKLVLKNMNITNSGHNDGPWNRHDINFGCEVEMENVNSDKALAFKAGADLTNVTIDDENTSDTYAIWIQPNGQTVTLDGCTIDMIDCTDGRGIKIDEQYIEDPEKVTLKVSDTTLVTEEKGAILVKSKAGADIILSEVDISGVKADSVNEVWVDSASAAYQELVTVTGGSKILEGAVAKIGGMYYGTLQAAVDAAVDGDTVTLLENLTEDVTITQKADVKFTIDGDGKTFSGVMLIDGKSARYETAGVTIQNVNFEAETLSADAFIRLGNGDDTNTRYTNNVTVKDCTFSGTGLVAVKSYTGGDWNLTLDGLTVNEGMHSMLQAANVEKGLKIVDCKVYSKNGANLNSTLSMEMSGCTFDVTGYAVRFGASGSENADEKFFAIENSTLKSDCDGGDAVIIFRGTSVYSTLNLINTTLDGTTQFKGNTDKTTILYDGKTPVADGISIDPETGAYEISNAAGLFYFAKQVNEEGNNFSGKNVKLVSDIDLANAAWTPIGQTGATEFRGVFDGQNYTISNLNVDSSAQTGEHYSSGLFGWSEAGAQIKNVRIDGASIKGNHNVAVIVGYTYSDKITNCHVANATVVCAHANNDACGDKAGIVGGYVGDEARVSGCSATDCTVTAGRDGGQLIGAGYNASVSDCAATNVTVTAGGDCTGANINTALIGRVLG